MSTLLNCTHATPLIIENVQYKVHMCGPDDNHHTDGRGRMNTHRQNIFPIIFLPTSLWSLEGGSEIECIKYFHAEMPPTLLLPDGRLHIGCGRVCTVAGRRTPNAMGPNLYALIILVSYQKNILLWNTGQRKVN